MYYSKEIIAQIAELVHRSLHDFDPETFNLKPPFNAEAAIEAFGGQIVVRQPQARGPYVSIGEVRPLEPFAEKRFEVSIPNDEYPPRRNFTLAHELGHVILHYQWSDQAQWEKNCAAMEALQRDLSPNRIEYEANYFSSFFLMPEESIRGDVSRIWNDAPLPSNQLIQQLAEQYNVSLRAMEIRLNQLGIL